MSDYLSRYAVGVYPPDDTTLGWTVGVEFPSGDVMVLGTFATREAAAEVGKEASALIVAELEALDPDGEVFSVDMRPEAGS